MVIKVIFEIRKVDCNSNHEAVTSYQLIFKVRTSGQSVGYSKCLIIKRMIIAARNLAKIPIANQNHIL